jgi:hypothetical protein
MQDFGLWIALLGCKLSVRYSGSLSPDRQNDFRSKLSGDLPV